jgi:hypothetical protein
MRAPPRGSSRATVTPARKTGTDVSHKVLFDLVRLRTPTQVRESLRGGPPSRRFHTRTRLTRQEASLCREKRRKSEVIYSRSMSPAGTTVEKTRLKRLAVAPRLRCDGGENPQTKKPGGAYLFVGATGACSSCFISRPVTKPSLLLPVQ